MSPRSRLLFFLLVACQVAHSVEEYVTRLWEVLAPARLISGFFSDDLPVGFAIFNAIVIAVGIWCCVGPVRSGRRAARLIAWLWVGVELSNGVGHLLFAALARGYFSGAITAVALVCVAACLALSLTTDANQRRAPARVA